MTGIGASNLPLLKVDPRRLKQIFLNLLSNAVKFTKEGGIVSCDAYVEESGDMAITITDTGIGMDKAGVEKAMTKFGQADTSLSRTHEGTGLGLPLTKGLVELHGGLLTLDSSPDKGTKITIRIPRDRVLVS